MVKDEHDTLCDDDIPDARLQQMHLYLDSLGIIREGYYSPMASVEDVRSPSPDD